MGYIDRLRTLYRDGGVGEVYRGVADYLKYSFYVPYIVDNSPRVFGVHAGVIHRNSRLLKKNRRDDHKCGLMEAIAEHVDDDSVTLIAVGQGLTTVHAIRAGAKRVTAYEGSKKMIAISQETFELNLSPEDRERISVQQAIVGDAIDVRGSVGGASVIKPSNLNCDDLLLLDCEGAEISILEGLEDTPQTIICETHPDLGGETDIVIELMESKGYDTDSVPLSKKSGSEKRVVIGVMGND